MNPQTRRGKYELPGYKLQVVPYPLLRDIRQE